MPNLVNTVKGEAKFEQATLTQVVEARAKATSTTDPARASQSRRTLPPNLSGLAIMLLAVRSRATGWDGRRLFRPAPELP